MASAAATAAATAASKTKQQPAQPPQQQQQPAQGLADPTSVTAKVLSLENEKLKAQLVALRQQAAEAEESRRMAVLAADNAASERDEYRSQVQELQEQLKEVMQSHGGSIWEVLLGAGTSWEGPRLGLAVQVASF
jgi:hypothetical protein